MTYKSHLVEYPGIETNDIYRALNKCQKNAREHLLIESDIKEGKRVMDLITGKAENIIFHAYSGYASKARGFSLIVTCLALYEYWSISHRIKVCRVPAIVTNTGLGPRYTIALYNPILGFNTLPGYFPAFRDTTQRGDYWLINSRENV